MKRKIGTGGFLLVGILILTWYFVFRNYPVREMMDIAGSVDLRYVFAGIACMGIFIICEGVNIRRTLKVQGCGVSFIAGIRYAIIGFFFSSVTPASTGGQPVQLVCMHRDGVPAANASLALLLELSSYQAVVIGLGTSSLAAFYSTLENTIGDMSRLILVGVLGNVLYLSVILMAVFSKRVSNAFIRFLIQAMEKLHIRNRESIRQKINHTLEEYQKSAQIVRAQPGFIIKMLGTTVVQMIAMYSVPVWVYLAFVCRDAGAGMKLTLWGSECWQILALQAILHISVSVLPLPGAAGVSEGGFLLLFGMFYTAKQIGEAMFLSRGISFYLPVLLCGGLIAAWSFWKKTEKYHAVR